MFNRILIVVLLFTGASAVLNAQEDHRIKNFTGFMNALKNGEDVKAVFEYGKCKLVIDSTEEKSPDVTGGMAVEEFEYFPAMTINNPKGYVAFSKTVLISHRRHKYVWNYVKVRVYEDNSVEINARYIKTDYSENLMEETFYGVINDGTNNGGVNFYTD